MIETVISWDGHTFAPDYRVDFVQGTQPRLPPAAVAALERTGAWPVVTSLQRKTHKVQLLITILDYTDLDVLRTQLFRWFDPEDETPKELIVENGAGIQQSVFALCEELRLYSDPRHQEAFVVTLTVDGDPRWRAEAESPDTWEIEATGDTHTVNNTGEDDAYPIFNITPTDTKDGGYLYRRWIPIVWNVAEACANYSLEITSTEGTGFDHAALVPVKAQAGGEDLRVEVDGLQVDRWLSGANSEFCKVWVNLAFQAGQTAVLDQIIPNGLAIILASSDISGFPSSGILLIDDEAFTYTSKNNATREFFGVTEAAKGTSGAAHAPGATIYWIQHDVWLVYGNDAVGAPTVDDTLRPAFELDLSTNWEWVYASFASGYAYWTYLDSLNRWASSPAHRSQRWIPQLVYISFVSYGTDHGAIPADPYGDGTWDVLGLITSPIYNTGYSGIGRFFLHNPCGILEANFSDGEKCREHVNATWTAEIQSSRDGASWATEYSIATPVAPGVGVWEAWSRDEVLEDGAKYVALYLKGGWFDGAANWENFLQAEDCTLTLDDTHTPTVEMNEEQSTYSLACRITNNETGEAIDLAVTLDMDETLEVDTDHKTVIYLHDNSVQLQALTLVGGVRRHWLRLVPGTNELQFDDVDTVGVTIEITWQRRYY
jgi:hypothetical protein